MSLIINGIDFDKRCDEAKRQLHLHIEWIAQVYELLPFYKGCYILPESDREPLALWMKRKNLNGYVPLDLKWEATDISKYVAALKDYIENPQTWPRL